MLRFAFAVLALLTAAPLAPAQWGGGGCPQFGGGLQFGSQFSFSPQQFSVPFSNGCNGGQFSGGFSPQIYTRPGVGEFAVPQTPVPLPEVPFFRDNRDRIVFFVAPSRHGFRHPRQRVTFRLRQR